MLYDVYVLEEYIQTLNSATFTCKKKEQTFTTQQRIYNGAMNKKANILFLEEAP